MSQEPRRDVDLSELKRLTPWSGPWRSAASATFPSTVNMRWAAAFSADADLLGRVLRDILKAEKAVPGRHGPRPGLDFVGDMPALDRLRGLDPSRRPYSLLPFAEAFGLLLGGRSVRNAARRLEMTPTRIHRLRSGKATPTMAEMEAIAAAFDKHPAYFREYRTWAIHVAVVDALDRQPDVSVTFYERLWHHVSRNT